jgi:hypothetical protein
MISDPTLMSPLKLDGEGDAGESEVAENVNRHEFNFFKAKQAALSRELRQNIEDMKENFSNVVEKTSKKVSGEFEERWAAAEEKLTLRLLEFDVALRSECEGREEAQRLLAKRLAEAAPVWRVHQNDEAISHLGGRCRECEKICNDIAERFLRLKELREVTNDQLEGSHHTFDDVSVRLVALEARMGETENVLKESRVERECTFGADFLELLKRLDAVERGDRSKSTVAGREDALHELLERLEETQGRLDQKFGILDETTHALKEDRLQLDGRIDTLHMANRQKAEMLADLKVQFGDMVKDVNALRQESDAGEKTLGDVLARMAAGGMVAELRREISEIFQNQVNQVGNMERSSKIQL